MKVENVSMCEIKEPIRPARSTIDRDRLTELTNSIRQVGLLQPILIRELNGKWEIEAGHRRYLAASILGWTEIPAIKLITSDDRQAHVERAHENLVREDLNIIEEVMNVSDLVHDQSRGVEEVAKITGKSIGWIDKRLEINQYPDEIKLNMKNGKLNMAQAKELSRCGDKELRDILLETVLNTGASASTIKVWTNSDAVESQIMEQRAMSTAIGSSSINSGTLKYDCGLCRKSTELPTMKHVWLCSTCLVDIVELSKIIQKDEEMKRNEREENQAGEHTGTEGV